MGRLRNEIMEVERLEFESAAEGGNLRDIR